MKKRSVVVIGAGLAGSLVCNELVPRADVTLLEIGQKDRIHYPAVRFARKPLAHVSTFCFGGGGTTNLWHNGLIPIDLRDVSGQEFRDVLAEARSHMDAAASKLFFKGKFSSAYADAVSAATAIARSAGILGDGVDCLVYPKQFHPLTVDPRVTARYSVDHIRFLVADGRVRTVEYTAGGSVGSVEVDDLIVAAGAMGSPKIVRDIITATGQRSGEPGTGFIDHPIGFVGKVRFRRTVADAISQLSLMDRGDHVVRSAIRLKSDCGRYTCGVFFRPALTMWNQLSIYKYKSLLGATTGLTRARNAVSWKLLHPDILAEVVEHLFGMSIPSRTYNLLLVAEQRRGDNRVWYDNHELSVDWSISNEELTVYRSLLARLRDMLLGVAEQVNIETHLTEDWLWSGAHHSGTTRLGTTPADLIDTNLRLKCCDNVYVCDGSVIQEHSYANTGLTIGQLALGLASRVRAT